MWFRDYGKVQYLFESLLALIKGFPSGAVK